MKNATLLGLAIGDALGAPFEFSASPISDWDGSFIGTASFVPGQWTDDTKMATYLSKSLIDYKGFILNRAAESYLDWLLSGDLRGIGRQTLKALGKVKSIKNIGYASQEDIFKCGTIASTKNIKRDGVFVYSDDFCGNGSVMRVAPIGVFFKDNLDKLEEAAIADAAITHNHVDAIDSSHAMALIVAGMLNGKNPTDAVEFAINTLKNVNIYGNVTIALEDALNTDSEAVIAHGINGTAHATLATAVWCFLRNQKSFKDTVISAVKLLGDADTRGAIAGALSGTYLGREKIPEDYVEEVEESATLQMMDDLLYMGPEKLKEIKVQFLP